MPEYEVEFATRYMRRQFEKGVGGSVIKVLTEAITNADDSYRTLEYVLSEAAKPSRFGSITIDFDRQSRTFAAVDQAEGLSDVDMAARFVTYGEELSRPAGVRTRGLFGKGIRDVLFTQLNGQVKSVKDGKSYVCRFRWKSKDGKNRPVVDIRPGPDVTPDLRKSWGIVGNGSRVEFKLREGIANPQFDKLAEKLEGFYMLRLLTSNPARRVVLQLRRGADVIELRQIRYVPPADALSVTLGRETWDRKLPDGTVHITAELKAFETDLIQGDIGYEEREGGLLVFDENNAVLDLTLFSYDVDPAAARFYGALQLDGIGQIIRDRLNASVPEEILTETRDGFDRKNPTYQELKRDVEKWLAPFVDDERKRRAGEAEGLSTKTKKRHEEAFDRLNSLYRKLLGDSTGSGTGTTPHHLTTDKPVAFRWQTLLLSTGSAFTAQLLVNTALIPTDESIRIESSDPTVLYPVEGSVLVPQPGADNRTVVVGVKLEAVAPGVATLRALWNEEQANLVCSVVDEDAPDMSTGLAFHPDTIGIPDGERKVIKLFADLRVVGDKDLLGVASDNSNVEATLTPLWEPVTADVVRAPVAVIGHGKGQGAVLTATAGSLEAIALVQVVSKKTKPMHGGHFRGYKFQDIDNRKVQALTDSEGYVIVNLLDPTNRLFFGDNGDQAAKRLEESNASQTLLADLVLGECLQQAVQQAYETGKLPPRLDTITDVQSYIAEQRFEIGAEIYKLFVTRPAGSGRVR